MPVERISDKIVPLIQEALERHALGDTITWEITMGPQGTVMLSLTMPHIVLGEAIINMAPLPPAMHNAEAIDAVARSCIEQMRTARSQATQVPLHGTNGHGPSQNNLGG